MSQNDPIPQALHELLVRDLQVLPERVNEAAHLRYDLGLDSLALMDLMLLVQKDFGFKATASDFREVRTVGALVRFIQERVAPAKP